MQKTLNPIVTKLKAAVFRDLQKSRHNVSFFEDELKKATEPGSENYRSVILAALDEWRALKQKTL